MKAIDLFSGPGGLSIGMKAAGIEPVACVEKNKDAVATYEGHTPDAEHFCTDIRKINFERYRSSVDVVYGGPPASRSQRADCGVGPQMVATCFPSSFAP